MKEAKEEISMLQSPNKTTVDKIFSCSPEATGDVSIIISLSYVVKPRGCEYYYQSFLCSEATGDVSIIISLSYVVKPRGM